MLLNDLLKRTDEDHPDHPTIRKSVVEMSTIAMTVNNSKKSADASLKVLEIQNTVKRCPQIVTPARYFLGEISCIEVLPEDPNIAKQILDEAPSPCVSPTDDGGARKARPSSYVGGGSSEKESLLDAHQAEQERSARKSLLQETLEGAAAGTDTKGLEKALFSLMSGPLRCNFREMQSVMLYVFSDILVMASHERISTAWGRAQQSMKAFGGSILQQPSRVSPV